MIKIWTPIVALMVVCAGCSTDAAPPATIEAGILTACVDVPYEPFEYEQGGELRGIDVDLVRAIAAELKLQAKFKEVAFEQIFDALRSDECDLVASAVSMTDERLASLSFSDGYFQVSQSLLARSADKDRFDEVDDLNGERVAVQKGTTGAEYATTKGLTSVPFDDPEEMAAAVVKGDVAVAMQDFPVNKYLAQNSGGALGVSASFAGSESEEYGLAFARDNTALRDSVDDALSAVKERGEYAAILKTYLGATG